MAVGIESLDHREEGFQVLGVVDVRHGAAELAVDLGQDRAAETVLAAAEIDQDQVGLALVQAQLRGQACLLYTSRCV